MNHVEKKLVQDFEEWRAKNQRNGTTNKMIKKDLEEFMGSRFQIKPNQTEGEQPLTILDILDLMIAPDVDASLAANSVRQNAISCQKSEEEEKNSDSAFSCPNPRFTLSGTKCFHVSTVEENYENAVSACQRMGAELAEIGSLADDEMVSSLRGGSGNVFIGLNDIQNEGSWVWQDGSPLASYTDWLTWSTVQEPQGQGDCVLKYHDRHGWLW